jgi:hypothetical protein
LARDHGNRWLGLGMVARGRWRWGRRWWGLCSATGKTRSSDSGGEGDGIALGNSGSAIKVGGCSCDGDFVRLCGCD